MEGLNAARKRGRLGGRPKIPTDDVEAALKMYDSKSFTLAEIEMRTGVKRPTLYLYLNRRKNQYEQMADGRWLKDDEDV